MKSFGCGRVASGMAVLPPDPSRLGRRIVSQRSPASRPGAVMTHIPRKPFVLFALCLGIPLALAQSAPSGQWDRKAPLPSARNETALASAGGKIYELGGSVGGVAQP